ncbi:hypothetical protein [Myxococcus sp. RHSTA-1-4]|uniref:hypothetical protein n=1 Tax=Myxococcus sp. RHSTA-1-4 TaxID=2874601 RepID=UPI001CBFF060|nr:hypothetical protein [Myxococcus sp. RHSTA-1-4]MBZ4421769.1 hypothetical protein [Myxococcus sp. RHSTA-1-4]
MTRFLPHDGRYAWSVLLGLPAGARPTERLRLARGLPVAAERYRCGLEQAPAGHLQEGVAKLWALARPRLSEPALTQWPALATACLAVADLLSFRLESPGKEDFLEREPEKRKARALFAGYRRQVGAPVHALVGGAGPVRVFRAVRAAEDAAPVESDLGVRCRALVTSLLGDDASAVWKLEREDVRGPSWMAAVVLREIVARWPEASGGVEAFGITGELDADGLVIPVGDIPDKVSRFFTAHPKGVCFVPASQLAEARQGLRGLLRGLVVSYSPVLCGYQSVTDLLVRMGVVLPHLRETLLFDQLRKRSRSVMDWRSRRRPAEQMLDLEVSIAGRTERSILKAADVVARLRWKLQEGASVVGDAGSGKSMFLRRLHHELLEGAERWSGPSVRVDGGRLEPERSLLSLVAADLGAAWSAPEVEALLRSPALSGSVWLLVDGVDEPPPHVRALLLREVTEWPGRFVLGSRPIREVLPGLRLDMEPLSAMLRRELLQLEGRRDLMERGLWHWNTPEPDEAPIDALLHDLARTPFGVSLVATLIQPERLEGTTKQRLLAEALRDMVSRAVAEVRLDEDSRVLFDLRGERLLGAAAWAMLREARAELYSEDFDALPPDTLRSLLAAIERSGIVQRAGPGRWVFNHKSFAEHSASRYLLSRGTEEAVRALAEGLGQPGVDEVLLHTAPELPREALSRLLEGMLDWGLPFSALTLATRVLNEVEPSRLEPALATRVLEKRLALLTWLPTTALPGGAGRDGGVWRALGRLAEAGVLHESEACSLLAACHPEIRERLQPRSEDAEEAPWSERWRMAERLVELLPLELPVPVLLRFQSGAKLLVSRRGRGPWALTELGPLLDSPDYRIAGPARAAWCECAPVDALLERLELLSVLPTELVESLLRVVLEHGSEQHKKEALLRTVVPRNGFRYWVESREAYDIAPLAELGSLSSEQWLDLWSWAWATGALGEGTWDQPAIERLYAHYLHDACGPARWRAVRALKALSAAGNGSSPLPMAELKALVWEEPLPEVRLEALEALRDGGVEPTLAQLWPSLVSLEDGVRWRAWSLARESGWHLSLEQLLTIVSRYTPTPRQGGDPERSEAKTPMSAHFAQRADVARSRLSDAIREHCQTWRNLEALFRLGEQGPHREAVQEVLASPSPNLSVEELGRLLQEGTEEARRWAAKLLGHGWHIRDGTAHALLAPFVNDADPELAALAAKTLERQARSAQTPQRGPAAWADEQSVRGFDLFEHEREPRQEVAPLQAKELAGFSRFEALWTELGRRPLQLKGARDMTPAFTDEAIDWFVQLASQAQDENLEVLRPVLAKLSELFRPELITVLVDALDDPKRGYLAAALLGTHSPGRALLPAFQRSEKAAVRAANVALGTPLAPAALDALLDVLAAGGWKKQSRPRKLLEPTWIDALRSLGGLEALARLLERQPPEHVWKDVIAHIESHGDELAVRLSQGTRARVAEWARTRASEDGEPDARASALDLLTLLGTADDAREWSLRLKREVLPASLTVAALGLLARLGSPADIPVLETLVGWPEPAIATAAVGALAEWAEPERLLQLLREPPPTLRRHSAVSISRRSVRYWRGSIASGIVLRGNRAQALELAWLLRGDSSVWTLARDEGRLPEHALLVLGYVRSDPGDSVMPASVTGGGDEVFPSGVPEEATAVVRQLAEKLSREEVVSALVEAALREDDSDVSYFLDDTINALGGPGKADVPRLLQHLREQPGDRVALALLARTGAGEMELAALWDRLGVPWWRS